MFPKMISVQLVLRVSILITLFMSLIFRRAAAKSCNFSTFMNYTYTSYEVLLPKTRYQRKGPAIISYRYCMFTDCLIFKLNLLIAILNIPSVLLPSCECIWASVMISHYHAIFWTDFIDTTWYPQGLTSKTRHVPLLHFNWSCTFIQFHTYRPVFQDTV